MKLRSVLTAAVGCLLVLPLIAADRTPVKAGKWEFATQIDMPGMSMPARTFTKCVTPEDAAKAENMVPEARKESKCSMKDLKIDGRTVTWKVECQRATGEGKVTYSAEGDSYTGSMHMTTANGEMKMNYTAKRVGPCD